MSDSEYHRQYYADNRERMKAQIKEARDLRRVETQQFISDYKISKGCERCGYNRCAAALEAHHLFDKKFTLGKARDFSIEKIEAELAKCEILCANCHREEHAGR